MYIHRLRQCCCHPVLMISDSMGDVNVEEGLEEAFTSLAIDHVTDVNCHVTHVHYQFTLYLFV